MLVKTFMKKTTSIRVLLYTVECERDEPIILLAGKAPYSIQACARGRARVWSGGMLAAQGLYSTNTSYWTIRHPAFGGVGSLANPRGNTERHGSCQVRDVV